MFPVTSSFSVGLVVPMPTFPPEVIRICSAIVPVSVVPNVNIPELTAPSVADPMEAIRFSLPFAKLLLAKEITPILLFALV